MNLWTMIVSIVAIVMVAHVIERSMKHWADKKASGEIADDADARFAELEDRIRVLERIVTENKFDLKKEIDGLR